MQEYFLQTIARRNRWLIKLRFGAFVMLFALSLALLLFSKYSTAFEFQPFPLIIISAIILLYNLLFVKISKVLTSRHRISLKSDDYLQQYKFHDLHFSLIQIVADFIALMFFIHYTGGVETPLFVFFFFHVIIGSLILPGSIMYLIVTLTLIMTSTGAWLEYEGIIPHFCLNFLPVELYDSSAYLILFFTSFAFGLYLATYLANSIAKELYRREQKLASTLGELEEAEKKKSRYVMTIVHDLKTPIAAAATYINMIIDGTLGEINPAQKRPLERIKVRLDNAISTINDILYISKLKAESNIEDFTDVDLIDLFNEIYNDMRILIKSKNINFSIEYSEKENFVLQAESNLLKLALANLISNSVKYTEQDGTVKIILKEQPDKIYLTIADNGIGIPKDEQKNIFKDFYRSSVSKSKGIEGTGLGLSFVKDVVQRLNGEIRFKSPSSLNSSGRPGTQFDIILPKNFSII